LEFGVFSRENSIPDIGAYICSHHREEYFFKKSLKQIFELVVVIAKLNPEL
jgi:hypothetical protein